MPFPELPADDRLEHEILERWAQNKVESRALKANEDGPSFVFYEGPPTANGKPAIHHVFARTLKDTVCRHRQMTGHRVPRKAGWDTQGLPVEIEVQKQAGITHRDEIEALGIAEFNRLCRDSVFTYKADWEKLSQRMAYWLDYENPYVTYESDYIQSCWAILKRFHEESLLTKDHKILPFCPTCSTGLSNHEVAQGYEDVQDPSVFVRFGVAPSELGARVSEAAGLSVVSLLVWTTTPWTLPSNTATAVDPSLEYVLARHADHADEAFVLAAALAERVLGEGVEVLARFAGETLLGLAYTRPFDDVVIEFESDAQREVTHTVRAGDFVTAEDGTGIVHMAPAFGADDFSVRQRDGLPLILPVDEQGRFTEAFTAEDEDGPLAGVFVKDADKRLMRLLKRKGLLFKQQTIDHSYPHCWRCRSPLLYMARPSWYLRTTELREKLVANNRLVDWHPPEIGEKRFGAWLENNVDWAISRERYWGTPLNVWICDACGHEHAPGSLDELVELRGEAFADDFDPHRPYIDEVVFACPEDCGGTSRRTSEVIDCWFDSGAMPFAQAGWPQATDGELPADFPADFICEGLDQTRGWFYTLHAISTFLTGQPAYKSVLVNNLVLDAKGKKMSKSRGNVVDPWEVFDSAGADAARWGFLSGGQVWLPKRYDGKLVAESARRVFGTLRNCYAFLAMYANLDGWEPGDKAPPVAERASIDRWLVSRLETLTEEVGTAYERLDLHDVARLLESFLDEQLSNWYVRRNRARFWKGEVGDDKRAAFATLREALERFSLLMAPAVPFLSEWIWCATRDARSCASVHLADWPELDPSRIDAALEADMDVVLRAVVLGRSVRATHDLKTRQPLARVLVKAASADDAERLQRADLAALVAEELNVKAVEVVDQADFRELSAKPDFRRLGPRFGKSMKAVAAEVAKLDEDALAAFESEGMLRITLDGESIELDREDVQLVEKGREGYAVAGDGGLVLALDTQLDETLIGEGRAREIVSRVQSTRKAVGLDVADRVRVHLSGASSLLDAARTHEALILEEVLGVELRTEGELADDAESFDVDGEALQVQVTRAD